MASVNEYESVDVIILSWDRTEDTILAINSSVIQKNVNLNVYIVDQGSTAECIKQIQNHCDKFTNVHLFLNGANSGVPEGRNIASKMGNGKIIVSLDNDAEFESEYELGKVVSEFSSRPSTAVIAFKINRFGSDEDDLSSWSYGLPCDQYSTIPFFTTRFVGAGHAIRRDVFESINGYDNSLFFLHEEVDLSRRFINAGYQIEYLPDIRIGHKVSAEHRVSWSEGRWAYHARNKTYLGLKFRTKLPIFVFHTLLLLVDGMKKKVFTATFKGVFDGIKLYKGNKHLFIESHVTFNDGSEKYYREYTPGASGSYFQRFVNRIKETVK